MLKPPRFLYFLADERYPVDKANPLWRANLPIQRPAAPPAAMAEKDITYGEYFEAVSHFLVSSGEQMACAAGSVLGGAVQVEEIADLSVFLEKHGAFYHPSRVVGSIQNKKIALVVNVAVSSRGKLFLAQEVANLNRLNRLIPYGFIPKVYASGQVDIDENRAVAMFMGDWFDAYAEFHVSKADDNSPARLKVWDPERGPYELTESQSATIYEQAAEILTTYYSVDTYEQIFSWHHAAGDFIVKLDGDAVRLKLVTVRRYERMLDSKAEGTDTAIQALLLFLLNMTLRMQIDRLDGVGELVWLDSFVIAATLRGFFKGLERKEQADMLPAGFAESLRTYLSRIAKSELSILVCAMAERLPSASPERALAIAHAKSHTEALYQMLTQDNSVAVLRQ